MLWYFFSNWNVFFSGQDFFHLVTTVYDLPATVCIKTHILSGIKSLSVSKLHWRTYIVFLYVLLSYFFIFTRTLADGDHPRNVYYIMHALCLKISLSHSYSKVPSTTCGCVSGGYPNRKSQRPTHNLFKSKRNQSGKDAFCGATVRRRETCDDSWIIIAFLDSAQGNNYI